MSHVDPSNAVVPFNNHNSTQKASPGSHVYMQTSTCHQPHTGHVRGATLLSPQPPPLIATSQPSPLAPQARDANHRQNLLHPPSVPTSSCPFHTTPLPADAHLQLPTPFEQPSATTPAAAPAQRAAMPQRLWLLPHRARAAAAQRAAAALHQRTRPSTASLLPCVHTHTG